MRPSTSSEFRPVARVPRPSGARLLAALAVAAASAAVAAGCSHGATEGDKAADVPTITADIGKVTRQDIGETLTVRGTITAVPNQDVKISALVAGRVMALGIAEGDRVGQGQVVAEIDPQPLEDQRRQAAAAHESATAAVENAKANLNRTERLLEKGIAAGKEVEDAKLQLASAEAQVAQTRAALDAASYQVTRTKVVSPIAGIVVKRLVNVGEQVDGTAAQPLLQVANVDLVELAANVPAEQLGKVRVRQAVAVRSEAYPDHEFRGEVIAIAPAVDPATNTALARVRVANPERLLKVGMFAQALVMVDEHKQALVVPTGAIAREGDDTAVYVVAGDAATKTAVKVGIESPEVTEILEGVAEGQAVLTTNVHGLGEKVKVAKSS